MWSRSQIALCHSCPPPPTHHHKLLSLLLLLLLLLLFTRLLFIPTSCSDVLKKFLTAAIAFHRCSLQLLKGAMLAVLCPPPLPLKRRMLQEMLTRKRGDAPAKSYGRDLAKVEDLYVPSSRCVRL